MDSENSLLGKLLMDHTSSIAPSTSNIIVRALNVSNCSTRAGSKSIQAEVLPFETVTNTLKHEKTCSFCQKPEYLKNFVKNVVNHSAIAQLHGIKLTQ